jgi:regulator of replication initiation timing
MQNDDLVMSEHRGTRRSRRVVARNRSYQQARHGEESKVNEKLKHDRSMETLDGAEDGGFTASGEFRLATNTLKKELAELRAEVQSRDKREDALQEEIAALRQQLADKQRNFIKPGEAIKGGMNQVKGGLNQVMKFSEMLRFGDNRKQESDPMFCNAETSETKKAAQSLSVSVE